MSKTALYLIYFCLYSVALLIIGKGSLRGDGSLRGYLISERKVGLFMCVCTFTGTWVSPITILSLTGSVYEDGLPVLFYSVIPWFVGGFLLACMTKRLYDNDIITVPELFRVRYGSRWLQVVYGLIFICVYVFYLVSQYKGFGMVASALFDIPYPVAVLMVYLFIVYTTFGGYRAVVRTDAFNLTLLAVSLVVLFVTIVSRVGGPVQLYAQAGEISGFAHAGMDAPTVKGGLLALFGGRYTPLVSLSMFWGWGLGLAANPQYVVRVLGAKSHITARRMMVCSLLLLAVLYFLLVNIGLGMRVLVPSLDSALSTDEIIIHLINNELYSRWSGFFLFSVIGASISTANSQLLLIASSFSYDVVRALGRADLPEKRIVTLSRLAVVGGGTLALLLSIDPPAFTLAYGGDVWGAVAILLFPALYGTLLTRRITLRGVWASILVGAAAILVFYPSYLGGHTLLHPAMPGVLCSTTAMLVVSFLDRQKEGGL